MEVTCFNEDKITRLQNSIKSIDLTDKVKLFKALGNEKRQQVLHILSEEPCCVCDLAHIMNSPVPNISQYLKVLSEAELVKSESQGKFLIYSLTDKARNLSLLKKA